MKINELSETSEPIESENADLPDEVGESVSVDLPNEIGESELTDLPDEIVNTEELPPNTRIKVDGVDYYTDDNGRVYRVESRLIPNTEYQINGYKYKTDSEGRIISASGKIQKKDHDGRPPIASTMEEVGRGDQKETDDRGHLIADRFNGGNGLENLIPMDSELNRRGGDYFKLEDYLADAVESGAEVYVDIEVVYDGESARPMEFRITVIIDGDKEIYVFKNEGGSNYDE